MARFLLGYRGIDACTWESKERAEVYLKRFEIDQFKDLRPALASGGTRKATALAQAFVMRPSMMILDSPTQGLNHHAVHTLAETIKWHREEFGLRHVFAGTEDESFLKEFDVSTIEITNQTLRRTA